jgi:hypothetical protein
MKAGALSFRASRKKCPNVRRKFRFPGHQTFCKDAVCVTRLVKNARHTFRNGTYATLEI